jgi:hypothetical protein
LFQALLDLRQSIVGESDLQTLYSAVAELLRRVESGGDLHVGYLAAVSPEKQFDSVGWSPPWWGNWGDTWVTTSTIEIGELVIGLFDPEAKRPRAGLASA